MGCRQSAFGCHTKQTASRRPRGEIGILFSHRKMILINVRYQRLLMLGRKQQITILTAHVRAKQPTPVRLSETVGLGDVRFLIALIAADAGQNDHRANPCFIQMTLVNQMHAG